MKFTLLHFALLPCALQVFGNPIGHAESVDNAQFRLSQLAEEHPQLNLEEQRLLQFEDGSKVWMSEWEKIQTKARGVKFFDITEETLELNWSGLSSPFPIYKPERFNSTVRSVIQTLSTDGPKANLEIFSGFFTRYYRSDTGKESQKWLLKRIKEVTAEFATPELRNAISIEEFAHSWSQSSIILSIPGSSASDEIVVLGAHQDSINMWPWLSAPGADDDGSGSVTILEAYRALIAAGFQPNRTVEFHWYSAEEGGLLGSQAVARSYGQRNANVIAMLQMDMTAWVKKGTREEVGIVVDFVDPTLTNFMKNCVNAYVDIPYVETKCGYACSDHASWSKAGYRSGFAIESAFENSNKNIHSSSDTIDISPEFSFDHMLEFSKLAVGFAVELGEWARK